jgi:hypothetical protein
LVADKKIRQKHFPPDKWIEIGTFCAPAEISTQLEKVDRMIERDAEQTISHKTEVNNFLARLEAQNNRAKLLYEFNHATCSWDEKSVAPDAKQQLLGLLWLICILCAESICYAPIASVCHYVVAPR